MDIDAEILAFLESEAMDHLADYLQRGRSFAAMSDEHLRSKWADDFRGWQNSGDLDQFTVFEDIGAELRLRGVEPDYEGVRDVAERIQARLRTIGPDLVREDAGARIAAFYQKRNRSS